VSFTPIGDVFQEKLKKQLKKPIKKWFYLAFGALFQ